MDSKRLLDDDTGSNEDGSYYDYNGSISNSTFHHPHESDQNYLYTYEGNSHLPTFERKRGKSRASNYNPTPRLYDHEVDPTTHYNNGIDLEYGSRRYHKGGLKFILIAFALFFLFMMYIPVYKQANRRHADCLMNCSHLTISTDVPHGTSISSEIHSTTIRSPTLHANNSVLSNHLHSNIFKKLWSASERGSVAGWSYNTSRDTRTYVLPDNVTLLNQPKFNCKLNKDKVSTMPNTKSTDNPDEIFLLVIISSSMAHFGARSAIRDTWGNQSNYENLSSKFENITKYFSNVNVTDKLLSDLGDFSNFSLYDKRVKRDLSDVDYNDNHYEESEALESEGSPFISSHSNYSRTEINNGDFIPDLEVKKNEDNHSNGSYVSFIEVNEVNYTNKYNLNLIGTTNDINNSENFSLINNGSLPQDAIFNDSNRLSIKEKEFVYDENIVPVSIQKRINAKEDNDKNAVLGISHTENENNVINKRFDPANIRVKRDVQLPTFINENDIKNNIYLNKLVNQEEVPEAVDDPRFDHGDSKTDQSQLEVALDETAKEIETEKTENFDYYDYQTEVSNVMKIPPRGERFFDDNTIKDAMDQAKNVVKISLQDDKLKLKFHSSSADKTEPIVKKPLKSKSAENNDVNSKFVHGPSITDIDPTVDKQKQYSSDDQSEAKNALKTYPVQIKFLFLLGQSPNENNTDLQSRIDDEATLHGDIIQEGFIDSYNNLTLKSVMLLKWVVSNCGKNVRYVMKTDDDMYVNIPRLIEALQNKSKEHFSKSIALISGNDKNKNRSIESLTSFERKAIIKEEKLLMGDLICDARPISDMSSKWYSPAYMYGGKVYPRYLSGTGYVMSLGAVEAVYKAALDLPLFHLEDIYITGMCSQKAGIKPVDHPGFSYAVRKFEPCNFMYLITAHQMSPMQLRRMHQTLMNSPTVLESCEIKRILAKKNSSLAVSVKNMLLKLNGPILGSPRSFISGLVGLGFADNRITKVGSIANKKRKKPNNGCF